MVSKDQVGKIDVGNWLCKFVTLISEGMERATIKFSTRGKVNEWNGVYFPHFCRDLLDFPRFFP